MLRRKRAEVRTDGDHELRISVAYQHNEPDTADGRSQIAMPRQTEHAAAGYPAAPYNACPFGTDDTSCIAPVLGFADPLEDDMQSSGNAGYSETNVKFTRSRSLPTCEFCAVESEADRADNAYRPWTDAESVELEYQRSRYLSNVDPGQIDSYTGLDEDSMSLLTTADWSRVGRPTTSEQFETTL